MRRISINLPATAVAELTRIAESEHRPLDAVVRDAISAHVARISDARSADVFGLWRHRARSGSDYQENARAEWSREARHADGRATPAAAADAPADRQPRPSSAPHIEFPDASD
ncbi:CopG family transcriptional regulator [Burkholderia cenocepacia]